LDAEISPLESPAAAARLANARAAILNGRFLGEKNLLANVAILILDDDVASQNALRSVLDVETWRIRVVTHPSQAMAELAASTWNLVIVNAALTDPKGPLFTILKELAQSELAVPQDQSGEPRRKRLSVLFLVSSPEAKEAQSMLESEGLPYLQKPYHLHDFLEKVSDLLVEAGAIAEPIRSIGGFSKGKQRRRTARSSRDSRRGIMFASREDYQMTEEEMAEFERQEEDDRKKREKELKEIKERGHA
jgi:DNA-binding response OmpR family regulator